MSKFKVGDKVRVNDRVHYFRGREGTVSKTYADDGQLVKLEVGELLFLDHELDLIQNKKLRMGDKVRITTGNYRGNLAEVRYVWPYGVDVQLDIKGRRSLGFFYSYEEVELVEQKDPKIPVGAIVKIVAGPVSTDINPGWHEKIGVVKENNFANAYYPERTLLVELDGSSSVSFSPDEVQVIEDEGELKILDLIGKTEEILESLRELHKTFRVKS